MASLQRTALRVAARRVLAPRRDTRPGDIPPAAQRWRTQASLLGLDQRNLTADVLRNTSLTRAIDLFIREGVGLIPITTARIEGTETIPEIHESMAILEHPNNEHTADATLGAYGADWFLRGLGHLKKVRVAGPKTRMIGYRYWPIQAVHWDLENGVRKEYRVDTGGNHQERVPPEDMISVQRGISQNDPYMGLGMLDAVLPELTADIEIQLAAGRAVHNLGQGILITPDNPGGRWNPEQSEVREQSLENAITGPNTGKVVAFGEPVKTTVFGSKPADMMFNELQIMMQARVLGVSNIASNLLGLQSNVRYETTYAGMELAWKTTIDNVLRPLWRDLGEALTRGIIGQEFPKDSGRWCIIFDESKLPTLSDERAALVRELVQLHRIGAVTAEQIADILGYEYTPLEVVPDEPEPNPFEEQPDDGEAEDEEGREAAQARAFRRVGNILRLGAGR